jgi:hypothetical protein
MRGRQPACTHSCTYSTWKCAPAQHIGPFRVHVRDLGHTTTAGVGKLHFCARRTHQLNKLRAHSCMYFIYIYRELGTCACKWVYMDRCHYIHLTAPPRHIAAVKTHQLTHAVPLALLLAPFRPSLFFTRAASNFSKLHDSGGAKFGVRRQKDATLELLCGALQLIRPTRTGEIVYPPGRI